MTNPKRVNWTRCSVSGLVLTVSLLLRGRWISILALVARRWSVTNFAAATLICVLVAACGGSGPTPKSTLDPFLNAWSRGDWAAMRRLVAHPPADFVAANAAAFKALGVTHATFTAGPVVQSASGDQAAATVTQHYTVPQIGAFEPQTKVKLVKRNGQVAGLMVDRARSTRISARGESLASTRTGRSERRSSAPAASR